MNNLAIFSGTANTKLSQNICDYMGTVLGKGIVSHFPDGETMVKIEDDIRGKDCFIIQPTCPPVNENIMELLVFIDCLRRASAKSITAVIPYFGYARQDRKSEGRTPITSRMVADLIFHTGATRIVSMDLHAHQIEGFFIIPVDHLKSLPVFVQYLKTRDIENSTILSPDAGNVKTANLYAQELNLDLNFIDKRRVNGEEAEALNLVGEVKGKNVLIFDDMISTAGTICSASKLAKEEGAKKITVIATHGLFSGPAYERLLDSCIDEILISDTVPPNKKIKQYIENYDKNISNYPEIKIISVAKFLGEAIMRIYQNRSVSVLLDSDYENYM